MTPLNKSQKQAVEYVSGPLLIVAGAGTGKTTVIANKVAYLVEKGLAKPQEILAITFTEKAAREMEERVGSLLGDKAFDVWVSTFHAFGQKVLEQHGLEIGLPTGFRLLDEVAAWMLVRENLEKFNLDHYRPLGNPTKFIHALIKHFGRCKEELVTPEDYLHYAEELKLNADTVLEVSSVDLEGDTPDPKRIKEISDAYQTYNQLLLDNNVLDFSDLIYYVVKLLRDRPEWRNYYQNKFKYILVDEFQDTNWSQYELLKLLTLPTSKQNKTKVQLTVVGDDDQSIYKFRGASVSNILQFKNDFPNAEAVVLSDNYRSSQVILDTAYNFIQLNNPDRLEEKLKINKKLVANTKDVGLVDFVYAERASMEAELVVQKILELKKREPNLSWSDFAILCRANSYVEQFIPVLWHYEIPYETTAAKGLYREKIILDAIAFFRLLDNYHESQAVYRLLISPVFSLSENDLSILLTAARKDALSLFEAARRVSAGQITISENGKKIVDKFLALIKKGAVWAKNEPAPKVLHNFLEESGYWKILSEHPEKHYNDIFSLQALFEEMEAFGERHLETSVYNWLRYFNFVLESGSEGEAPKEMLGGGEKGVKLMSVHAAKGLEFTYVFVPNLVSERFPGNNRSDGIELPRALVREAALPEGDSHIEEERRLFYVALTRAKKGVFLSAAKSYGGSRDKKISRFISEIDATNQTKFAIAKPTTLILNGKKPTIEIENAPAVFPHPKELSYSQISTYNKCPWQYRFQFILRLPTWGKPMFSFGNTIHRTLQNFYDRIKDLNSVSQSNLFEKISSKTLGVKVPTINELIKMYEMAWQGDWYYSPDQREKYFENGKRILKDYYDKNEKNGWTIPIALEHGFTFGFKKWIIKGKIDRIEKKADGSIVLLDYKTGNPKDKLKFSDKEQLLLYQLATERVGALSELGQVSELQFYYLENNTQQTFLGTEKELQKLADNLEAVAQGIEDNKFTATPDKETCRHCDFKDICDFRI